MHFDLIFFQPSKSWIKTTKSIWIHFLQIHLCSSMFSLSVSLSSLYQQFFEPCGNQLQIPRLHCKCPGVEDRLKAVSATFQSALGLTLSLGFDSKATAWGHKHLTVSPIVLELKGWGQGVSRHGSEEGSLPDLLMALSSCVLTWWGRRGRGIDKRGREGGKRGEETGEK